MDNVTIEFCRGNGFTVSANRNIIITGGRFSGTFRKGDVVWQPEGSLASGRVVYVNPRSLHIMEDQGVVSVGGGTPDDIWVVDGNSVYAAPTTRLSAGGVGPKINTCKIMVNEGDQIHITETVHGGIVSGCEISSRNDKASIHMSGAREWVISNDIFRTAGSLPGSCHIRMQKAPPHACFRNTITGNFFEVKYSGTSCISMTDSVYDNLITANTAIVQHGDFISCGITDCMEANMVQGNLVK